MWSSSVFSHDFNQPPIIRRTHLRYSFFCCFSSLHMCVCFFYAVVFLSVLYLYCLIGWLTAAAVLVSNNFMYVSFFCVMLIDSPVSSSLAPSASFYLSPDQPHNRFLLLLISLSWVWYICIVYTKTEWKDKLLMMIMMRNAEKRKRGLT